MARSETYTTSLSVNKYEDLIDFVEKQREVGITPSALIRDALIREMERVTGESYSEKK